MEIWEFLVVDLLYFYQFLNWGFFYKDLVVVYGSEEREVFVVIMGRNCIVKDFVYSGNKYKLKSSSILKLIFMK